MKWVSVQDRLPKVGERIVVCGNKWGPWMATTIVHEQQICFHTEIPMEEFEQAGDDAGAVTHWIPIPKKPKQQGKTNGK